MSAIKLPVWVDECVDYYTLRDAEGNECMLHSVITALNGAPKRAFEDLTIRELCTMMEGAEVSEEELLSRLQAFAAPVIPKGWKLVPEWSTDQMEAAGKKAIEDGADTPEIWEAFLSILPPAPLRTEVEVRAEARREALEEAAKAAESCDSPFSSATQEQDEAVDLMARRVAETIRALIDRP
jgi:hypothetical protein